MNVIVCIKQVPETTEVKINPETNTLVRDGVKSIINLFDMYAIEEGVRLKDKFGGKVTVITMGPAQAEAALREAISMGADEGVLISDRAFAGSDTWATSYTLACAIKRLGSFDMIICGKQASDGDTAQVGPGISVHLDIPQVTYVKKIEEINDNMVRIERMTEEGYDVVESPIPFLITVVKEINEPRIASLKGMIKAKAAKIMHWTAQDIGAEAQNIGLSGSPTNVVKIFTPIPRVGGQILKGDNHEVVEKLVQELKLEIT
ncbi:MAG: electron transfer flavoprotein subunit beta/FixA family protein [Candidatus Omnitrophica bacterium]|nr:electron transfer flavoprotein subunit beta/FixA family protein [Candidatus Omnitrophota bacterium]